LNKHERGKIIKALKSRKKPKSGSKREAFRNWHCETENSGVTVPPGL